MDKLFAVVGALLVAALLIIVIGMLVSLPVYWLWNGCLVGAVTGVQEITWLQAWGLNILFGLLFKTKVTNDNK
jgi:hypothetical protein